MYTNISKNLFEGLAIASVVYISSKGKLDLNSFVLLVVTICLSFVILDYFSPQIATGARFGAGFKLGLNQVGGSEGLEENLNLKSEILSEIDDRETQGNDYTQIETNPVPNPTSACNMPPYLAQTELIDKFATVLKNSPENIKEVTTSSGPCYSVPYKLIPGQWSEQAVIAGYNENVVAANSPCPYSV